MSGSVIMASQLQIMVSEDAAAVRQEMLAADVMSLTDALLRKPIYVRSDSVTLFRDMLPEEAQLIMQKRAEISGLTIPGIEVKPAQ